MNRKTSRIPWSFQSQNVPLLVILACLLIMLFFLADELFGAIGLHAVYTNLSYIVSPLLILGGLALLALWIVGWVIGAGSSGSRRWYYW